MSEIIISKRCSHCKQIKPISEFAKTQNRKDGFYCQCKLCQRAANKICVKKYRQTKKGRNTYLKVRRRYGQSEKGKNYQKKWCLEHPESRKAKAVVNWLVRIGKLPRPDSLPCHYCPKPAKEYHHWKGYEPEHHLDVVPVCKKCHSEHPHYAAAISPARSK